MAARTSSHHAQCHYVYQDAWRSRVRRRRHMNIRCMWPMASLVRTWHKALRPFDAGLVLGFTFVTWQAVGHANTLPAGAINGLLDLAEVVAVVAFRRRRNHNLDHLDTPYLSPTCSSS